MSAEIPRIIHDTASAAVYLDKAPSTLEKLRVRGEGPKFLKMGRSVRYDQRDLDAYIDACRRASTSDTGREAA